MTYALDPEAKAFSYTREQLFECICRIISHPHKTITEHDQSRALAVLMVLDDYLSNYTQCQEDIGCWIDKSDATDFEEFVKEKLGISDYDGITAEEILK